MAPRLPRFGQPRLCRRPLLPCPCRPGPTAAACVVCIVRCRPLCCGGRRRGVKTTGSCKKLSSQTVHPSIKHILAHPTPRRTTHNITPHTHTALTSASGAAAASRAQSHRTPTSPASPPACAPRSSHPATSSTAPPPPGTCEETHAERSAHTVRNELEHACTTDK